MARACLPSLTWRCISQEEKVFLCFWKWCDSLPCSHLTNTRLYLSSWQTSQTRGFICCAAPVDNHLFPPPPPNPEGHAAVLVLMDGNVWKYQCEPNKNENNWWYSLQYSIVPPSVCLVLQTKFFFKVYFACLVRFHFAKHALDDVLFKACLFVVSIRKISTKSQILTFFFPPKLLICWR